VSVQSSGLGKLHWGAALRGIFTPIALVFFSMSGCNNAGDAEWVPMGSSKSGGAAYYGQKTIVRNGDLVKVWLKYFEVSQETKDHPYLKIQTELNCKMRTARSLLAVMHKADGTEVTEPLDASEASPILPDTPFDAVAVKLCSTAR
jgi:hypothetical protein